MRTWNWCIPRRDFAFRKPRSTKWRRAASLARRSVSASAGALETRHLTVPVPTGPRHQAKIDSIDEIKETTAARVTREKRPPSEARPVPTATTPSGEKKAAKRRPLIGRGQEPPGRRRGWKFSARKRGMYRRRPRRRLGKRAEPALAPRQRRDRIPPSEARRRRRLPKGAAQSPEGRPLISRGQEPPGRRKGWKFSARKRGMYRRRPRRRAKRKP